MKPKALKMSNYVIPFIPTPYILVKKCYCSCYDFKDDDKNSFCVNKISFKDFTLDSKYPSTKNRA